MYSSAVDLDLDLDLNLVDLGSRSSGPWALGLAGRTKFIMQMYFEVLNLVLRSIPLINKYLT
eukprot:SAG31_NODE_18943_length_617_cov_0.787645_1_plen_62_part_00